MNGDLMTLYAQKVAVTLNKVLRDRQVVAEVSARKHEGLLYVVLKLADENGAADSLAEARPLLEILRQVLVRFRAKLSLGWVKLVAVSGRLPHETTPVWQEDLLLRKPRLMPPGQRRSKNIGDVIGPLVIEQGNQLYSYAYDAQLGGTLNITVAPTVRLRPVPLSIRPKPFANLLDRKSVVPVIREALKLNLPVEVYGAAGCGKTVLMRYLAHDADVVNGFADGIVHLPAAKRPAADLLQVLYDAFYEAAPFFKPGYAQVQQSLKTRQALVILTGLTLAKEDMGWLMAALPECTFWLMSEERLYWQEGVAIALKGLPLPDALALIQAELGRPLSDELEQKAAQRLWTALSGSPLQLRRVAAQVRERGETLADWVAFLQTTSTDGAGQRVGPLLFRKVALTLSFDQQNVLALMGAMGGVALSVEQVQAISQVPKTAGVLGELANMHLIEPDAAGGFQLCNDLSEAVRGQFDPQRWLAAAADYFTRSFTRGAGMNNPDAAMRLLEWTQQTGRWQASLSLARSLDLFLSMSGRWQQWQQVLTHSLQAAQQMGNAEAEAWSMHQLGVRSLASGETAQAGVWLARAVHLREQLRDAAGAAVSRHNLGLIVPPLGASEGLMAQRVVASGSTRFGSLRIALAGLVGIGVIGGVVWLSTQSQNPVQSSFSKVVSAIKGSDRQGDSSAGAAIAGLSFDPQTVNFGEILPASSSANRRTLTITNTSDVALTIYSLSTKSLLIGNRTDFKIVNQTCVKGDLPAGKSCTVLLSFEPRRGGEQSGRLVVDSNAGSVSIALSGAGVQLKEQPQPSSTAPPVISFPNSDKPVSRPRVSAPLTRKPPANPAPAPDETAPELPVETQPNQPPVVKDVSLEIEAGNPSYRFDLLALSQAYDPDSSDTVGLVEVASSFETGGRLQDNGDGIVTYLPSASPQVNAFGQYTDKFGFTVADSRGETASGIVSIVVSVPKPQ